MLARECEACVKCLKCVNIVCEVCEFEVYESVRVSISECKHEHEACEHEVSVEAAAVAPSPLASPQTSNGSCIRSRGHCGVAGGAAQTQPVS